MFTNYFKIAVRNLLRRKVFSFINIMGLAVGMSSCFLMFLYVRFEKSYDDFNSKAGRIYRVVTDVKTQSEIIKEGLTTGPIAINVKKEFPEVEEAVRIAPYDGFLVKKDDKSFQEKRTVLADSTLFKVFDFPLLEGDKNTALAQPMSVVMSQATAKKYFGNANPV
ncbi:MAG TPA: ABC transporter permease, partial [Chitinophagaceae bacterium]|nr:ABC transporter permease [Chitinophagaceae bacterium]